MIYLSGTYHAVLAERAQTYPLGLMVQPRSGVHRHVERFRWWALDNGCFARGAEFNENAFLWWTSRLRTKQGCLFVAAPDVVGDAQATLARSRRSLTSLRRMGWPVAFVAQDGFEGIAPPWSDFDALFIGGSTAWKLSEGAAAAAREAKRRGKWVHVGRVNSAKRLRYAEEIGADSADGNFLKFGPEKNIERLAAWFARGGEMCVA